MEPEHDLPRDVPAPPIETPTVHDKWWWPQLLAALDKAGYRIVKKPEILSRAKPRP